MAEEMGVDVSQGIFSGRSLCTEGPGNGLLRKVSGSRLHVFKPRLHAYWLSDLD